MQKENEELIKLNEHILRDIEKHATDKHELNKEINKLEHKLILLKFEKSGFDLNKMLHEQKPFHDKGGLGFSENDKNTSTSQDKSIVFIKECCKPKVTDALTDATMRDQCARCLSKNGSSLNAFAKPYFPQTSCANIHNNTLHDFVEFTNDEHGSNLNSKFCSTSNLNDDFSIMFTNVDCTISKNGNILAKGHRQNNLYTC